VADKPDYPLVRGEDQIASVVVPAQFIPIAEPGSYRFDIRLDGQNVESLVFVVVVSPDPT